jgi:hypothetical protein
LNESSPLGLTARHWFELAAEQLGFDEHVAALLRTPDADLRLQVAAYVIALERVAEAGGQTPS